MPAYPNEQYRRLHICAKLIISARVGHVQHFFSGTPQLDKLLYIYLPQKLTFRKNERATQWYTS